MAANLYGHSGTVKAERLKINFPCEFAWRSLYQNVYENDRDLGLCTTSGLAFGEPQRNAKFQFSLNYFRKKSFSQNLIDNQSPLYLAKFQSQSHVYNTLVPVVPPAVWWYKCCGFDSPWRCVRISQDNEIVLAFLVKTWYVYDPKFSVWQVLLECYWYLPGIDLRIFRFLAWHDYHLATLYVFWHSFYVRSMPAILARCRIFWWNTMSCCVPGRINPAKVTSSKSVATSCILRFFSDVLLMYNTFVMMVLRALTADATDWRVAEFSTRGIEGARWATEAAGEATEAVGGATSGGVMEAAEGATSGGVMETAGGGATKTTRATETTREIPFLTGNPETIAVLSIKTILFDILDFWCQLVMIRFVITFSKRRMFGSFMKISACWLLHRLITFNKICWEKRPVKPRPNLRTSFCRRDLKNTQPNLKVGLGIWEFCTICRRLISKIRFPHPTSVADAICRTRFDLRDSKRRALDN